MFNEVNIMRTLGYNKGLMNFYEIHESANSLYIIVEYLKGGDLISRIKKKRGLKESHVKGLMKNFLEDLVYIHSKHVMHRDIKPENIMFRRKCDGINHGEMVLIDFGLASFDYVKEYLYARCGTPGFVAPEVIKHKKGLTYNTKCDIFSAGIIFYIL